MKKSLNYYAIYHFEKNAYLKNSATTNEDEIGEIGKKDEHTQVVYISKDLHDFIKAESKVTNNDWIDLSNYKPEPIKLTFATLELNQEKLNERDKVWKQLQKEIPEFKNRENGDTFRFKPWELISKEKHTHFKWSEELPWYSHKDKTITNVILEEDDSDLDITGIYLTHLNGHNDIDGLTNHYEITRRQSKTDLYCLGVSDNATQIKKHIERCLHEYQYGNSNTHEYFFDGEDLFDYMNEFKDQPLEFVILLTPIANHHDLSSWGGWRWHKWGEYIGKHTPRYEYLDHETGIDFVFVWELYPVMKNN